MAVRSISSNMMRGLATGSEKRLVLDRSVRTLVNSHITSSQSEALMPGDEVAVSVTLPDIPRTITIKQIQGQLTIDPWSGEPSSASQESTITDSTGARQSFTVAIKGPRQPSSLEVRLDGRDVFWSFSNPTDMVGDHDLPDFSQQANAYLDTSDSGEATFIFMVKSDGPGNVKIAITHIDYSVIQTQSWPVPGGSDSRLDHSISLNFAMVKNIPLDPLSAGDARMLGLSSLHLDVAGEFGPERLLPEPILHDGKEYGTVACEYWVAQPINVSKGLLNNDRPVRIVGVTCLLRAEADAQVYVALHEDASGMPAPAPALGEGTGTLSPDVSRDNTPIFLRFGRPISLKLGTPYWVLLKGVQGVAQIGLGSSTGGYLGTVQVNKGGQFWKPISIREIERSAAVQLVYLPEVPNEIDPIEIQIANLITPQSIDVGSDLRTVTITLPTVRAGAGNVLIIRSRAIGKFTIANVIREYIPINGPATVERRIPEGVKLKMLKEVVFS